MKIFPAIDIKGGKCVRLLRGDFDKFTVYKKSPLDQAKEFLDLGFKDVHIIDLDGALKGKTVNLDTIRQITSYHNLKIEVGGGIRSLNSIKQYIDVGVDKVILGSGAIKNKEFLKDACMNFKNKIALGLDAKDGYLSISGWKENLNIKTIDYLKEVNSFGISRIIYTDINKDGMLSGPNLEETSEVAKLSPFPVIASGGVKDIDDLINLSKIPNVIGAICGVSLYENKINFKEALEMF